MKKVVALVISLVPLGIGIGLLVEIWSLPFAGFGALPIPIRFVVSCILAPLILLGGAGIYGVFKGGGPFELASRNRLKSMVRDLVETQRELQQELKESGLEPASDKAFSAGVNYGCPNCSATLGNRSDVSPHGDAKCQHCHRWFNIHGANPRPA